MKQYIAIENDKLVGLWAQNEVDIHPDDRGRYSDIREISLEGNPPIGYPLCCYNSDWSLKDEDELRRLGYDEEGNKLPTKEELAAQAKLQKKREALEAKRDKFAQWHDANENYEQYQLGAVAHTVAQPAVNLSDPLPVQRKKYKKAYDAAMKQLKAANKKDIAKAAKLAEKYKAKLEGVQKELEALD
ncbi:MAG: hypothetical protein AAF975_06990 [Spirochaetota bacterium]